MCFDVSGLILSTAYARHKSSIYQLGDFSITIVSSNIKHAICGCLIILLSLHDSDSDSGPTVVTPDDHILECTRQGPVAFALAVGASSLSHHASLPVRRLPLSIVYQWR